MARSPLFDIYDPYGELDEQARLGLLPSDEEYELQGPVSLRKPTLSDLMPAEEQSSMLGRLAAAGSSGLAGLGWILDTPGSMVRGLLSEGPSKAISALWETSDDRVTGRELARQYGLAGDEDNWANFFGGLGTEVLLDPLTYGSFGLNQLLGAPAKTLAGKAAQKSGLLNDFDLYARNTLNKGSREAMREQTARSLLDRMAPEAAAEARSRFARNMGGLTDTALDEALDAPIARMNRIGLPGYEGATDLFGKTVGDYTAKLGDQLGEGLMTNPYTGPALTWFNRTVGDADVLGMKSYDRQWEAKELQALRRARQAQDRRTLGGLAMSADEALRAGGRTLKDQELSEALRVAAETPELLTPEMQSLLDMEGVRQLPEFWDRYREIAKREAEARGVPLEDMESRAGVGFMRRQQATFDSPMQPKWPEGAIPPDKRASPYTRGSKVLNASDNMGRRRKEALDVLGGTGSLNQMSLDPALQEALRAAKNEDVQKIIDDWWEANTNLPLTNSSAPAEFWDNTTLLDEAGFDGPPAGMVYRGDGSVAATRASGPSNRPFGWLDQLNDEGLPLYQAPSLPGDHPLMVQLNDLKERLQRAKAGGEIDEIVGADGSVVRPGTAEISKQIKSLQAQIGPAEREMWTGSLYSGLADFLRTLDPQHASKGIPVFGQNTFNELSQYVLGRGRVETDADFARKLLEKHVVRTPASEVVGGVNYAGPDALKAMGLTGENARDILERSLGQSLDTVSFPKEMIDDWARVVDQGRMPPELNPIAEQAQNFLRSFKTLALASPSRLARDSYSGAFAASMLNSFNLADWLAGRRMRSGDYRPLTEGMMGGMIPPRLAKGDYAELFAQDPQAALRKFLLDAGGQGLGTSTASDELLEGAANAQLRELYPGGAPPEKGELARKFYNPDRSWTEFAYDFSPFAVRGGNGNRNPLLDIFDRGAEMTDAGNRYGTYLTQARQGAAPEEAARIARLTQVDYSPEAFTDFERNVLKRWVMPFYSYTRGIMPLIGDELVNRPAGQMGRSIRAITRGSEPSEDNFTPEYLRQSASIPLPAGGLFGLDDDSKLRRYLTNIDLPFESVINLITPGVGNNWLEKLGNTASKSALNILGQTSPLIKGPLEQVTNRQFYSGRQLSDLYSMLEQTIGSPGRPLEQLAVNLPGGSRLLGTIRQLGDDRLDASEKYSKFLVNALTGLKFQDVDMERTKRLAARDMLNELLDSTPGVRTYENITVPEDILRGMPEEQRKMYLLYKIIQSQAAKNARDRKKAEALLASE
jgi:hypothetical protein